MADNEIKILKSNTFEEWRQKSNELSLNLGADDRLDSRLTDRIFKHDNVSSLKLNIIEDTPTQVFQLLPDTSIDNTGGYIILAHGTSIPAAFSVGTGVTQTGGYQATIEATVTIDNKPKILVKNSTGAFNTGTDLNVGGTSIAHADLISLISESYNKAGIRVLNGATELTQGMAVDGYHVPTVSGIITLAGSPVLDKFVEGSTVYQDSSNRTTQSDVESNATWYGTVYHAGTADVYIKSHSRTYSPSSQIRILGYAAATAKIGTTEHNSFTVLTPSEGHVVEFNSGLSVNDDIQIIATDLVTAINEVQDDIGTVENLTTTAADLVAAVNEHEADLFNAEGGDKKTLANLKTADKTSILDSINEIYDDIHTAGSVTLGTNANFVVGGINELEWAVRGNLNNYTLETNANNLVSGINEIEAALRGANTNYTVTAGTNIRDGLNAVYADIHTAGSVTLNTAANFLVGGINELEVALRGTTLANYTLTTASTDGVIGGINEHDAELGTITSAAMGTDASTVETAILELETALRGTDNNYVTWGDGANIAAGDVRGAIIELGTTIGSGVITGVDTEAVGASNLTVAVNLLNTAIGDSDIYNTGTYGAATIAGTLDSLKTGVVNNDTDIGSVMSLIDGATTVDTTIAFTDLAATDVKGAIDEISGTTITAGAGLTGGGNLRSNKTINVVGATNGGITVNANSIGVDSTVVRTNVADQTIDSNLTFTTGNTISIPTGSTLDIDGTLLIGGGAGSALSFDTAFITLASTADIEGIEVDRSVMNSNTVQTTVDAKLQWNEGNVGTGAANTSHRAWQIQGLTNDLAPVAKTSDIVTFYNAKDLVAGNTETGINVTWDATAENFDFALTSTGVTANSYGSASAIPTFTVGLDGRLTAAGSVAITTQLTVGADSGSNEIIQLATEIFDVEGTANEIETTTGTNKVIIGLPDNVDIKDLDVINTTQSTTTTTGALTVAGGVGIAKNLHVGGNLTVEGTTTTINTETLTIDDNIIVLNDNKTGAPGSETAGIEIERGTGTNVALRWNDASDQWELTTDGSTYSTIITAATSFDQWRLGLYGSTVFDTITENEAVYFRPGPGMAVSRSGTTITYTHGDTSTLTGQQGTAGGGNVLQTVTVDDMGHVTSVDTANLDSRYMQSWTFMEGNGNETGTIGQGQTLHFEQGSGMSIEKTADRQLVFTNDDRGSSQSIFKNIAITDTNSGFTWAETGTLVADSNNDTVTLVSGTNIDIDADVSGDSILIRHQTFGLTSQNNSGGTVIQDVTLSNGHVTALGTVNLDSRYDNYSSWTAKDHDGTTYTVTSADVLWYKEGSGMDVNFTANDVLTFTNTDRGSSQNIFKTVAPSNGASATADVNNDTLNLTQGAGINTVGSGDNIITISHADTSSQASINNSGNNVIQDITLDTFGHITGLVSKDIDTVNNANNINVDETNGNTNYQVLFSTANGTAYQRPYIDTNDAHFTYNPSTQLIDGAKLHWNNINSKPSVDNYSSWTIKEGNGEETSTIGSGQTLHIEQGTGIQVELTATRQLTVTNTAPHAATNLGISHAATNVGITSSTGTNITMNGATSTVAGVLTSTNWTKLNGIDAGADVNENSFKNFVFTTVGTIVADNTADTMYVNSGTGIAFSGSTGNDVVNIHQAPDSRHTGTTNVYTGNADQFIHFQPASSGPDLIRFYLGNGSSQGEDFRFIEGGTLYAKGDIVAYSSAITSDRKLKTNIKTVENALDKVCELDGVTFDWKKDGKKSAGVIAQNVEEVLPTAVKTVEDMDGTDTHKVVDYNQLSALFIESIKELKEENKQLRAEIEALKDINKGR